MRHLRVEPEGEAYAPEVEAAWAEAYTTLATAMQGGAAADTKVLAYAH